MKFNAFQRYLLQVYAVIIIFLSLFVPTYTSTGFASYGFVLFGYAPEVNIALLLTEYLAVTLALVALLLATSDGKKK